MDADAAPELAGLGVAVEIDAGLSSDRVWKVLEHKVQCPQDYLPATDVVVRPNADGSTYREMTAMGRRIIEDIYTNAALYEVLFKVRRLAGAAAGRPAGSALSLPRLTWAVNLFSHATRSRGNRLSARRTSTLTSSPLTPRACGG